MGVKRIILVLAAACAAAGQAPRIGDVNLYGLHKVSPQQILDTAGVKPGGPLPPSKGNVQERLEELPDVLAARVEAVCCDGVSAVLFIGIQETGAPAPVFRSDPEGNVTLPEAIATAYSVYASQVQRAESRSEAPGALPARLASFATEQPALLRDATLHASDPDQRAVAAALAGYAPPSREIADDLHSALQDPDPAVRANAARSLKAIARAGRGIEISPAWFADLLNSVTLSDRTQAVDTLLAITDGRPPETLATLRERALPALAEMARWKTARYAMPPFLLLARMTGLSDENARQVWTGAREATIEKALAARPSQ